jgi:cation diffusion facilitator family transporter
MSQHPKAAAATTRTARSRLIGRVLWTTLALNWLVASLKLAIGHASGLMIFVADGLHSFADGASNVVGLIAVSISAHPADEDHPYGHRKFETLAATVISFLLFFVAFGIMRDALRALFTDRTPQVTPLSFAVAAVTLAVNVAVVLYERRRARQLRSELLESDAWHTMTDVFVTSSVFVALAGMRLGIPRLDALFSLGISSMIVVTALGILKRNSDILVDRAPLDKQQIERIVRGVEGVRDCHEIRTRGHADAAYVDLHVLVDSDMTVRDSHRVANIIENEICREIPGVADVVVHVEPESHEHDEIERHRRPRGT